MIWTVFKAYDTGNAFKPYENRYFFKKIQNRELLKLTICYRAVQLSFVRNFLWDARYNFKGSQRETFPAKQNVHLNIVKEIRKKVRT